MEYFIDSMSEIIVRKAKLEDLAQLLIFEQAIIDYERAFDSTIAEKNANYYDLKGMLNAKEVKLVVAECRGKLVGSGYAHVMSSEPYLKHRQNAYLGFMYVEPDFRGRGINRLIMQDLKNWCLMQGVREVRLDVYDANQVAVSVYEKAGFSKNLVEMRMVL